MTSSPVSKMPNQPPEAIPKILAERLLQFLLDRRTGNVQVNICEGRVTGFHIEEMVRIRSP